MNEKSTFTSHPLAQFAHERFQEFPRALPYEGYLHRPECQLCACEFSSATSRSFQFRRRTALSLWVLQVFWLEVGLFLSALRLCAPQLPGHVCRPLQVLHNQAM